MAHRVGLCARMLVGQLVAGQEARPGHSGLLCGAREEAGPGRRWNLPSEAVQMLWLRSR